MFHIPPPPEHVLHAHNRVSGHYLGVIRRLLDHRGRALPRHNLIAADLYEIENGPWVQTEPPTSVRLTWAMK
jgi:hypothetical protein